MFRVEVRGARFTETADQVTMSTTVQRGVAEGFVVRDEIVSCVPLEVIST